MGAVSVRDDDLLERKNKPVAKGNKSWIGCSVIKILPGISVAGRGNAGAARAIILRSWWRRALDFPQEASRMSGRLKMKLTKREQQVVAILLEGRSNKEIARRLGIAEGTVKWHLHSIFRKTGVFRRVALVAKVMTGHGAGAGRDGQAGQFRVRPRTRFRPYQSMLAITTRPTTASAEESTQSVVVMARSLFNLRVS
jgi:DNA-binding CsgD family transcriptional regulator